MVSATISNQIERPAEPADRQGATAYAYCTGNNSLDWWLARTEHQRGHPKRCLTQRPVLTKDFFVNLLDMRTAWKPG